MKRTAENCWVKHWILVVSSSFQVISAQIQNWQWWKIVKNFLRKTKKMLNYKAETVNGMLFIQVTFTSITFGEVRAKIQTAHNYAQDAPSLSCFGFFFVDRKIYEWSLLTDKIRKKNYFFFCTYNNQFFRTSKKKKQTKQLLTPKLFWL